MRAAPHRHCLPQLSLARTHCLRRMTEQCVSLKFGKLEGLRMTIRGLSDGGLGLG
jgi:hypothetical protein